MQRFITPYAGVLVITCFVFTANFVHAAENIEFSPNTEVLDLTPADIAKTVNIINPYTPVFEEDSIQVALAMKDVDFLGKPVITETAQTELPQEKSERKSNIAYTVQEGDTLSSIGWRYGLKIASIKTVNNLPSDLIKPGQTLKLPPEDLPAAQLRKLSAPRQVAGSKTPFNGTFGRPTSRWSISQYFGRTSFERWHTGIDLTSRSGSTIFASASGQVAAVKRGWGGGYGNHIIITHGNGFSTLYGHLSGFSVSSGQWVNQGQAIGAMGSTGWSTGVHLHFEIRVNGVPKNPLDYL